MPISQYIYASSGNKAFSSYPNLVSDDWGRIHAFWASRIDDKNNAGIGDTIYYSFWNGSGWSTPIDVIYQSGNFIWLPKAAADSQGRLHLIWTNNDGTLWYSQANLFEAASVRAWSAPLQIIDARASGISIAIDPKNNIDIAYCQAGQNDGVYFISSADGKNWSDPVYIDKPFDQNCSTSIAIDQKGRIHMVWDQEMVKGKVIYYSRSEDGGNNWVSKIIIDQDDERYGFQYGPASADIITYGTDEVHIVWDGSPLGQRWHTWSKDGGFSWFPAQQVNANHRGLTLPNGIGIDSNDVLHVFSAGIGAENVHFSFQDNHWSPMEKIGGLSSWDIEYASLAISRGNLLFVAWTVKTTNGEDTWEIWTAYKKLDAPEMAIRQAPTLSIPDPPTRTSPPSGETATGQQPTPTFNHAPIHSWSRELSTGSQNAWGVPVYTGILSSGLLIAAVFIFRLKSKK